MEHKGAEGGETELRLRTGLDCKRPSVAATTFSERIVSAAGSVWGFKLGSCKVRTVLWENDFGSGEFYSYYLGAEKGKHWQMKHLALNPQPGLSSSFPECH